jgi:nitroimidazol reductase NimA-like FMN-containing flavoprotein (pyridoxamine 5'-phosphate oxidase superfamily)
LTVDECFDLLRCHEIGRIAVGSPYGPPFVAPVTYVLDGTDLLFRSNPGAKLDAVDQLVSFQVDEFDRSHRSGWSVLLQGQISLADDADVAHLELDPWIGSRAFWIRLVPAVVTGRRLALRLPDLDGRGYR